MASYEANLNEEAYVNPAKGSAGRSTSGDKGRAQDRMIAPHFVGETGMLIALRLLLSDRVLNPFENKIDVAIRIGPLPDSGVIATRIGSGRVVSLRESRIPCCSRTSGVA